MKNIIAGFIIALVFCPISLIGQTHLYNGEKGKLFSAKSFKCDFEYGYHTNWKKDHFKSVKAELASSIIDSINHKTMTARLVGHAGISFLTMKVEPHGLTFTERTDTGNYAFTTIFLNVLEKDNNFPVVTSRHMAVMVWPMPSQYYGKCKILK